MSNGNINNFLGKNNRNKIHISGRPDQTHERDHSRRSQRHQPSYADSRRTFYNVPHPNNRRYNNSYNNNRNYSIRNIHDNRGGSLANAHEQNYMRHPRGSQRQQPPYAHNLNDWNNSNNDWNNSNNLNNREHRYSSGNKRNNVSYNRNSQFNNNLNINCRNRYQDSNFNRNVLQNAKHFFYNPNLMNVNVYTNNYFANNQIQYPFPYAHASYSSNFNNKEHGYFSVNAINSINYIGINNQNSYNQVYSPYFPNLTSFLIPYEIKERRLAYAREDVKLINKKEIEKENFIKILSYYFRKELSDRDYDKYLLPFIFNFYEKRDILSYFSRLLNEFAFSPEGEKKSPGQFIESNFLTENSCYAYNKKKEFYYYEEIIHYKCNNKINFEYNIYSYSIITELKLDHINNILCLQVIYDNENKSLYLKNNNLHEDLIQLKQEKPSDSKLKFRFYEADISKEDTRAEEIKKNIFKVKKFRSFLVKNF